MLDRLKRTRLALLGSVAFNDLVHGWQATVCLALGVAVALAPLLLLYGLNFGFVEGLIEQLRQDPRTRELKPVGQFELDTAWFERYSTDPRVQFVLPKTRYLASAVTVRSQRAALADVQMVPSIAGDPLLPPDTRPNGLESVVISASVQARAGLQIGDEVQLQITRTESGSVRLPMRVVGVVDRSLMQRDAIFTAPEVLDVVERWRQGEAIEQLGWEGDRKPQERVSYASFRMFARDVRDVPGLRDSLVAQGIDVRTRAESIASALAIERGLGWVFSIVIVLTTAGFLLTLGLHLVATVVEKARELSILRLLGFRSRELALLPMLQGGLIALAGALVSGVGDLMGQSAINERLAGLADFNGELSQLHIYHVAIAVLASSLAGGFAGAVAGIQASRLEPAEGLRRE